MNVRIANLSDAETISKLAHEIWPHTYRDIVSAAQIEFMLEKAYTVTAIETQMQEGQVFFILDADAVAKGFASVSKEIEDTYKICIIVVPITFGSMLKKRQASLSIILFK